MPRLPVTLLTCLALAAGGAIVGCGDDEDAADTPATTTAAPAPDSATAAGDELKITMKDIEYVPQTATAKVGQKIVWENTDGEIPHTVTATDGAKFDSGNMPGGATFDHTPTKAGTIDYVCTIHPQQTGKIIVKE